MAAPRKVPDGHKTAPFLILLGVSCTEKEINKYERHVRAHTHVHTLRFPFPVATLASSVSSSLWQW